MPYKEGFIRLHAPFREDSEALADIGKEAEDYGISPGEFLAMLGVAWSKAKRGQWNPLWPVQQPVFYAGNGTTPFSAPIQNGHVQETDEQRGQREEEEKLKKRRLAAAREAARE